MISSDIEETRRALETEPHERTVRQRILVKRFEGNGPVVEFVSKLPDGCKEVIHTAHATHLAKAKALKRNPGRWARIMVLANHRRATSFYANIRRNRYNGAYQPARDYHMQERTLPDGQVEVYCMYAPDVAAGDIHA